MYSKGISTGRIANIIENKYSKYNYPASIRKSLKSSNAIERLNEEIRRRIKTISSFPDEDSAMKIFYYKSIEYNSKHAFIKMKIF